MLQTPQWILYNTLPGLVDINVDKHCATLSNPTFHLWIVRQTNSEMDVIASHFRNALLLDLIPCFQRCAMNNRRIQRLCYLFHHGIRLDCLQ